MPKTPYGTCDVYVVHLENPDTNWRAIEGVYEKWQDAQKACEKHQGTLTGSSGVQIYYTSHRYFPDQNQ